MLSVASQCLRISIHALREEGDGPAQRLAAGKPHFYPRPPRGGRPGDDAGNILDIILFLSTPSARRATRRNPAPQPRAERFLSTPSARRATTKNQPFRAKKLFLSTPSARRATFSPVGNTSNSAFLSTPSARRATGCHCDAAGFGAISIHALREEGDISSSDWPPPEMLFLSTPSARRATVSCRALFSGSMDFYPRPPRGGRRP